MLSNKQVRTPQLLILFLVVAWASPHQRESIANCEAKASAGFAKSERSILEEEDSEVEEASTILLQAGIRQSRVVNSALLETSIDSSAFGRVRLLGLRSIEVLSNVPGSSNASEEAAANVEAEPDLLPIVELVQAGVSKDDSDPMWASAHELIRRYLKRLNGEIFELTSLCSAKMLDRYASRACQSNSSGANLINGIRADAYLCGSHKVDWSTASWPVNDLCKAPAGSAYSLTGFCGSQSKKKLVLNFLSIVPKWKHQPSLMNIPSVSCILGLGDCDIHFCQHCSAVCENAVADSETSENDA
eukprot:TRINITY_DN4151_c0_g2_i2.p1 TRINITY_DN4151_c0_g2~~TRINITY_DN4151_c0_g2_i2.p1  ORF type:complete len:302 (-),score=54.10 TRINITY_DN4151_c0_g2_i2:192-1097(-)